MWSHMGHKQARQVLIHYDLEQYSLCTDEIEEMNLP